MLTDALGANKNSHCKLISSQNSTWNSLINLATIKFNSISTNRLPGHVLLPTPNGTTIAGEWDCKSILLFVLSVNHLSGT